MSVNAQSKLTRRKNPARRQAGVSQKACGCGTKRRAVLDPETVARCNGLRYVLDDEAGYRRRRSGKGFSYYTPRGKLVRDKRLLDRFRELVIPPAWEDVWISLYADSHLQVTGVDARGRKQYRYHEKWREVRDQGKYERLLTFSQCLPRIRQRVQADLMTKELSREKVLATVVRLLEVTCIRVGNESYARDNESYGLTTLRDHHVDIRQCKIRFNFRGKSGKDHNITLEDCALAKIVKNCRAVPGEVLFQYEDENGESHRVTSTDVNRYLREISGRKISAKDFRTWWGSVLAALALRERELPKSQAEAKRQISDVVKEVSEQLGNTPAVCRKCYIHPAVISAFTEGRVVGRIVRGTKKPDATVTDLLPEEKALIRFLKQEWQRG